MSAPCKIELVAEAMGLKATRKNQNEWRFGSKGSLSLDLNKDQFFDHEANVGGGVTDFVIHMGYAQDQSEAIKFLKKSGLIADAINTATTKTAELRHHIYTDEQGNFLRKATKFEDGRWLQHRWEKDQWIPKVIGVRNVVYGLDRLTNADKSLMCFVFEGEKDVERAWEHGLTATCNVSGAGKWTNELNYPLIGRTVCIVPDNDDAGYNHAKKVLASLQSSGIDAFILWNYLHGLNNKADFSDWMDLNDNNVEKFLNLVQIAEKDPRQSETPHKEATSSELFRNKRPTEDELADLVLNAIGIENVITNDSGVMHWNEIKWVNLVDERWREIVRRELRKLGIPLKRSLLVNVSNLIKDRSFDPSIRFNPSKNQIVSVLNGDLQYLKGKWELSPPNRERMRTTVLPHAYDPEASAPCFMQFLDDIFEGDVDAHEKANLVLQHIGYALQSHADLERFAIYVGTGGNGKSVLLHTLKELLGIENVAAVQPHMLKSTFHRASLNNKLANIITESELGGKLPSAEIKALVSGEAMTVDHKYGHPFVMEPFATLFWATNHLPHPHDYSDALYRRVDILEFNRKFTGNKRNRNLRHELKQEMPGILNAALNAYTTVLKSDFEEPMSVVAAKAKWRENSNPVACWCEERLERAMCAELQSQAAYDDFKAWCEENGHKHTITHTTFSERMKLLGYEKTRKKNAMFWRDVKLV